MKWPIVWLASLALASQSYANGCGIWELLARSNIQSEELWTQISHLHNTGQFNEENVRRLIRDHSPARNIDPAPTSGGGSGSRTIADHVPNNTQLAISMRHDAKKALRSLPSGLKRKAEEAINLLRSSGVREFYNQPGRWNIERIPELGGSAYTIRLNDGYRVVFDFHGDHALIREINQSATH